MEAVEAATAVALPLQPPHAVHTDVVAHGEIDAVVLRFLGSDSGQEKT